MNGAAHVGFADAVQELLRVFEQASPGNQGAAVEPTTAVGVSHLVKGFQFKRAPSDPTVVLIFGMPATNGLVVREDHLVMAELVMSEAPSRVGFR